MSALPEENVTHGLHAVEPQQSLTERSRAANRAIALETLEKFGGDKTKTARALGIGRKTLYRWLDIAEEDQEADATQAVAAELDRPARKKSKASVNTVRQLTEAAIEDIVSGIPEKARKASLKESVDSLAKLVPVLKDLYLITNRSKPTKDIEGELKARVKAKLAKLKDDPKVSEAD